jgi:hypothetical protein
MGPAYEESVSDSSDAWSASSTSSLTKQKVPPERSSWSGSPPLSEARQILGAGLSPTRRAETSLLGSIDSCSTSQDLQVRKRQANLWQKRSDQQSGLTQLFHASTNAAPPEPSKKRMNMARVQRHLKWATWFSEEQNHDPCGGSQETHPQTTGRICGDHPAKKLK